MAEKADIYSLSNFGGLTSSTAGLLASTWVGGGGTEASITAQTQAFGVLSVSPLVIWVVVRYSTQVVILSGELGRKHGSDNLGQALVEPSELYRSDDSAPDARLRHYAVYFRQTPL